MRAPSFLAALGLGADEPQALRDQLAEVVAREVPNAHVLAAIRAVPRHLFVPEASLQDAYGDHPLPIGHGATISQPTVVAMMSAALELRGDEHILEIGTGSGYAAAVLAALAPEGEIDTVEFVPALAERAARVLADLGVTNVRVHVGDGWRGLPERAPFDRIVVTAAPEVTPPALVEQLREDGCLVVPVGPQGGHQELERFWKRHGTLEVEELGGVRFVPMVRAD